MTRTLLVVAGEASGDLHGAQILEALKARCPDLRIIGVGGPRMTPLLDRKLADIADLAVMGLTEVIRHLPRLLRLKRALLQAALEEGVEGALLIDYQDFNRSLAKALRKARPSIHLAQYVCPQVWVWRAGRIPKIGRLFDTLYCLLPFEPPLFQGLPVEAVYLGNPLVDEVHPETDADTFLREHHLDPALPVVAVLPGSRPGEILRLMPVLTEALRLWPTDPCRPRVQWVLPVAASLNPEWIRGLLGDLPVTLTRQAHVARSVARAALVCSGTATLETALLGTPSVLFYKVSALTALLGRMLVKVAHIGLVNIIADRRLVPELIQEEVTAPHLVAELERLLDPVVARAQREALAGIREKLGPPGAAARVAQHLAGHL